MKTVLAVFGAVAVLALILVVGGGYYVYKKGATVFAQATTMQIENYMAKNHPPEATASALRRLENGVKLHPSVFSNAMVAAAMAAIQNGEVTAEKLKMLNDTAQLAEQGNVTREQYNEFLKKYGNAYQGNVPDRRLGK